MSRTADILSACKIKLKQVAGLDIQQPELLFASNLVQNQILREAKCNEISFVVTMIDATEAYDISANVPCQIKELIPSWTDAADIVFVANANWKEYRDADGSYPIWVTQFSNSLYFSPIPSSTDTITVWAYKVSIKTAEKMSVGTSGVEPVIPESFDACLILGICAWFDKSFGQEYEVELARTKNITHQKTMKNPVIRSNW